MKNNIVVAEFSIQDSLYTLIATDDENGHDAFYFKREGVKMLSDEIAGGNYFETESGACWALLNNFSLDD